MIPSIQRLRQLVPIWNAAPAILLIINIPLHPDPVAKRPTGYAGVLPVPAASSASQLAAARLDPLLGGKRDARADRGRVLYAAGHAPVDTATALARASRHHPCPEQRVGETAPRFTAPNS
ncbi:MAG TPA: hypothetical protein VGM50_23295 [Gemmatimonadaceae bacterium]